MSASMPLQKAVFERLTGDAALIAMIGADGVRDHVVTGAARPCVAIVAIESRDWSTATEPGEEHLLMLEARTGEGGHRVAQAIADRVRGLLDDAALEVEGYALVNLAHRRTRVTREARAKGHVAEMVFRAVTE